MTRNNADFTISLLGAKGTANPNAEMNKMYEAEGAWYKSSPEAGKRISLSGARDFTGETLFHPAMDEIPGIEKVRSSFDPKNVLFNKKLTIRNEDGTRGERIGGMSTGGAIMFNPKVTGTKVLMGHLTHEIAHHVLSDQFGDIGHNWAMARAHVHLVRNQLGNEAADQLVEHYKRNGVNFGGRII